MAMKCFVGLVFLGLIAVGCTPSSFHPTEMPPIQVSPQVPTATATSMPTIVSRPTSVPAQVDVTSHPLFKQAIEAVPDRYRFAVDKGAQFVQTSDGKSFYVLWTPKGFDQAQLRPMIVTLHGHASWAFDEFFIWQPYAEQRGYGILALQWWFGGGEAINDYYLPREMYPLFEQVLRNQAIEPGKVLFHGFSRGSANSYALTALDRQKSRFFGLTVSNAGGAAKDFPPNAAIINNEFGAMPFKGAHWVLYCGGKDPNPERDGCVGMQAASKFVISYGAIVDLFIEDPTGDHGGFHRNPANVNKALDVFDGLIRR